MKFDAYAGHFDEDYLTLSQTAARDGIDNSLPDALRPNLMRLSNFLFGLEASLIAKANPKGRLGVSSGFRCHDLNAAVGGVATSAHTMGLAGDLNFTGMTAYNLALFIEHYVIDNGLRDEVDQIIQEFGRWVHVGLVQEGVASRHQLLSSFKRKNTVGVLKTVYVPGILVPE